MESTYQVDVLDVDLIEDLLFYIIVDPDQVLDLAQRSDSSDYEHEPLGLMVYGYVLDVLLLIIVD